MYVLAYIPNIHCTMRLSQCKKVFVLSTGFMVLVPVMIDCRKPSMNISYEVYSVNK